jgi:hypothetical protein
MTPRDAMTMNHAVVVLAREIHRSNHHASDSRSSDSLDNVTATRLSSKFSLRLDMHVEQRLSTPIGPESVSKVTVLLVMVPVVLAIAIARWEPSIVACIAINPLAHLFMFAR